MSRHTAPSACVTMRPDATGALVVVGIATPAPARKGICDGAVFGAWHSNLESWWHEVPVTLEMATEYQAIFGGDLEVCFRGADGIPKPLNAAEQRAVRAMLEDGAE